MKERGIVIEINNGLAKVRLTQKPECASCGICSRAEGMNRILTVHAHTPLEINQLVTVEVNEKVMTLSTILLFGVPIAGFLIGAFAGYMAGGEKLAVILGFSILAADFFAIRLVVKKMRLPERAAKIIPKE